MADLLSTAILGIYLIGILIIGYIAHRRTTLDPSDFYIASRGLGTIVLTGTVMASSLSAYVYFGVAGTAASSGLGVFVFQAITIVTEVLVGLIIGKRLNEIGSKLNVLTPMDHLRDRYESPTVGIIYIIISSVFLIPYVAVQIIGGGIALETLINLDYELSVVIMTIIMAIYVHFAGMRGVAWTDLTQGIMMFIGLFVTFFAVLFTIGPETLVSQITTNASEQLSFIGVDNSWLPFYTVAFGISTGAAFMALPHIYQRLLSAGSPKIVENTYKLFLVVVLPMYFVAIILAIWAVGILPPFDNPDYVIALLVNNRLGRILGAILLAAAVAALMSTADSLSLSISSMISRDIYGKYVNPDSTDRQEVHVTRIFLVLVLLISLGFSFLRPGAVFELTILSVGIVGTSFPAIYLGILWKKATNEGAIVSMIAGPAVLLGFYLNLLPDILLFGTHRVFISLLVALILWVGVSLITNSPTEATIENHFQSISQDSKSDD